MVNVEFQCMVWWCVMKLMVFRLVSNSVQFLGFGIVEVVMQFWNCGLIILVSVQCVGLLQLVVVVRQLLILLVKVMFFVLVLVRFSVLNWKLLVQIFSVELVGFFMIFQIVVWNVVLFCSVDIEVQVFEYRFCSRFVCDGVKLLMVQFIRLLLDGVLFCVSLIQQVLKFVLFFVMNCILLVWYLRLVVEVQMFRFMVLMYWRFIVWVELMVLSVSVNDSIWVVLLFIMV